MGVDEVLAEARARLESVLAPINGGVGEDASYDEGFETIKRELDKANALEGGSTDWSVVESTAENLLAERSKDFRLALYYAAAATQTRKLAGMFDGILILLDLCNTFWEPMFPALKRPRARGNLCSWMCEVTTPHIQHYQATGKDRDVATALQRSFRELDGFLADKLGEAYPGMMTLRDAINQVPLRIPAEVVPVVQQPKPQPSPAGPVSVRAPVSVRPPEMSEGGYETPVDYGGGGGGGGGGMGLGDIVDVDSAYRALAEITPLVGRAADMILQSTPTSADGYRLGRVASWLQVGGNPYAEGGQTQIDGPGEHIPQALKDLIGAQDWSSLLATASQVAGEYPLYLDAVHAMVLAFEGLGVDYDQAKTVVVRETAALVARAPELPNMTFINGVPIANEDAKQWAKGLAAGGGGGGGGGAKSPVDKAVVDADKLFTAGQVPQAVSLLSRVASQVSAPAYKFKARLEIAKVCLRGQLLDIARAQLEALERVAEEHRLSAWDPEICAEMYANLYRARKAQSMQGVEDAELPKKITQALQRLTELDAAQALLVMQEGSM